VQPWRRFSEAVREAYAAGYLGQDFEIVVHRGAGAYICGEETGLISSLEGKKGWPKVKPPFPAIKGAFGQPTIVNNVETLCCVPPIVANGAAWFAGLGTKTQGGTRMYSVSGRVKQPAVYEAPVSITLRQLIFERAGGVSGSGRLKAVVPGGGSAAILTADEIDVTMDVDGLRNAGTMIGSAGVMVMDESVSIPEALMVLARFYAHESCGQCTPCREGTTICAFYDGAVGPYVSYIEKFRPEFEALIRK
jgi:NADH-quinone oxidoreductase subunit F